MKRELVVLLFKILGTGCIACGSLLGYAEEEIKVFEKPVLLEEYKEEKEVVSLEPVIVEEPVVTEDAIEEEYVESSVEPIIPVVEEVFEETSYITGNKIQIGNIYENNLMKDENGEHFYLNHNLEGIYDGIGVPYIDFRNDFSGRKTILYAHSSMVGNGPFQILQNYHNNPNFYYQNPNITITYNGVVYTYQIFSVYVSLADTEQSEGLEYYRRMSYTTEEWENTVLKYKNNSEYETGVSVNGNDKILILQTCSMDPNYYQKYYRYNLLVMGKLISIQ